MKTIEQIKVEDVLVASLMKAGATQEQIIAALVSEKNALLEHLIAIDSLRSRKFKTLDGKVFVWHCPDELIPVEELHMGEIKQPHHENH